MEQIKELTGLTAEELRKEIKGMIVESVMNNTDNNVIKKRVMILNALYDLV